MGGRRILYLALWPCTHGRVPTGLGLGSRGRGAQRSPNARCFSWWQGKVVPRYKLAAVILLVCGAVLAVPYGHPVATLGGAPQYAYTMCGKTHLLLPPARTRPPSSSLPPPPPPPGVLLAVLSTLSVGVKAVLSSILLDKADESGLIPVVVAWYDALFSGCILLVVCTLTGDIPRMFHYFADPHKP